MLEQSINIASVVGGQSVTPASIAWYNINVYSKEDSGFSFWSKQKPSTQIIKNVSGEVHSGSTLAIMGSSGAGKTTLLNVLTARNLSHFRVDGVVKINGQIADVDMITSMSAYVQQDDMFFPTLTVREHLVFQSLVRMEQTVSDEFKLKRINDVMRELSLEKCAETRVGGNGKFKGISGGEMKRLSFAAEILTNPSIMFCDEPTSGLDAFMASNLVTVINKMAEAGRTIICTIHQPASEVFNLFQNLLLMADGRVAYLGDVQGALTYFSTLGMKCPMNFNPADFYVHEMAVIPGKEIESKKKLNRICDYFDKVQPRMEDYRRQSSFVNKKVKHSRYKASCFQQYQALTWRSYLITSREPLLTHIRLGQGLFISLVLGLVYMNQYYDQRGVMNINGALYILLINLTIQNCFAVINVFCSELPIFIREHNNGMYRVDAYCLCKYLAEIPVFVFVPIIVVGIYYYMVGLYPSPDAFLYTMMVGIIVSFAGVSFGYFISSSCKTTDVALSIGPPLLVPLQLMGGYFLNNMSIPKYLAWIKYLSWFHYGFDLLAGNQWTHVNRLECNDTINHHFSTTASMTSSVWNDLSTPNSGGGAGGQCLRDGKEVLEFLDLGNTSETVDYTAMIALCLVMRFLSYVALYLRAKQR